MMTETAPLHNRAAPPLATFVGFGFGAIQAGLFAFEALSSRSFRRLVIAEVVPAAVASLRRAGGAYRLNIAHADRVESLELGPVEVEDPAVEADRARIVEAVVEANEIATAVPSVRAYETPGPGSIHRLLATGLARRGGRPAVVYTAENHTRAAEILEAAVLAEVPPAERGTVSAATRFVNTVIGKMSAVVGAGERRAGRPLAAVTPGDPRAFLVESFNRILIGPIDFPAALGFRRGLEAFEEKADLRPFEEAKLYGHNAIHALAAYLASLEGLARLAELAEAPEKVELLRAAFTEECGEALCRRWRGADPVFTPAGFRAHAGDLLARMLNPFLGDPVARVARDPARKLAWDDRLVGSMRLVAREGLRPRRLAAGAAAALVFEDRAYLERARDPRPRLRELWDPSGPDAGEADTMAGLIADGLERLRAWRQGGTGLVPALERALRTET
jgi:mannitol-1-phosphate 5-dehydrogenase